MQPNLREPAEKRRGTTDVAAHASRNAAVREWARGLGVALAAGVFLSATGALGTDDTPLVTRLLYWLPLMVGGLLVADVVVRLLNRIPRVGVNLWIFGLVIAIALTAPIALIVWAYTAFIFGRPLELAALPYYLGPVFIISSAMTAIMMLVNRPGRLTTAPAEGADAATIRFLERLPAKLKGAVIYAVSAEDHYLRLHTSKGADLILMRLADAITELDGLEGAQTHRSWWVARDAVESARRAGDRVTLLLKGGAEAPVSRPNVKPLREAGWF